MAKATLDAALLSVRLLQQPQQQQAAPAAAAGSGKGPTPAASAAAHSHQPVLPSLSIAAQKKKAAKGGTAAAAESEAAAWRRTLGEVAGMRLEELLKLAGEQSEGRQQELMLRLIQVRVMCGRGCSSCRPVIPRD